MPTVVIATGPVFDGRADKAMADFADQWTEATARAGSTMVRANLNQVLKVQTPHYRLMVAAKPDPPGWKVTDQGVIYGPWLEGTGSRNFPKTRFRGYATFRRTTAQLAAKVKEIGEHVLPRFLERMR